MQALGRRVQPLVLAETKVGNLMHWRRLRHDSFEQRVLKLQVPMRVFQRGADGQNVAQTM
jgi:hypothetical protein